MATIRRDSVEVKELSEAEAWEVVDAAAQRELGMSAGEFIEAWEAGRFDEDPDRPEVMHVVMLLSLLPAE